MIDTKVEKEKLRKWAKEVRLNLDLKNIGSVISNKILHLEKYKSSQNVMSYHPKDLEISLKDLFADKSKNWFLPTTNTNLEKPVLIVPYIPYKTKLNYGIFGVYEPEITNDNYFDQVEKKVKLDLIFVPGLCFDKNGHRIGYGKGIYDRFLKLNPGVLTIGCCPKSLLVKEVPADEWDIKVDMVITD